MQWMGDSLESVTTYETQCQHRGNDETVVDGTDQVTVDGAKRPGVGNDGEEAAEHDQQAIGEVCDGQVDCQAI